MLKREQLVKASLFITVNGLIHKRALARTRTHAHTCTRIHAHMLKYTEYLKKAYNMYKCYIINLIKKN